MKRFGPLFVLFVVMTALTACADSALAPTDSPRASTEPDATSLAGENVTVFAASSLTDAFNEIGDQFSQTTGAGVSFNFGGSSDLRTQLEQGAPADVFATADEAQMSLAHDHGVVDDTGQIFARNRLVVIIPKDNRAGIATLQDLANPDTKIALANETVPVGKYARQFLDKASADSTFGSDYRDNVLGNVVTQANNVKEVASAVQLDEVDAGIVYKTDVTSELARDVTTIDIPDNLNVIATYPITPTAHGSDQTRDAALAFIEFVLTNGQAILESHGFQRGGS